MRIGPIECTCFASKDLKLSTTDGLVAIKDSERLEVNAMGCSSDSVETEGKSNGVLLR